MTGIRRIVPSLLLDALVVLALVFPDACAYLRWPVSVLYLPLTWVVFRTVRSNPWILWIVHDTSTRIAHGFEHATLAVLDADGLPAGHGFTHGRDRFMVALRGRHSSHIETVRTAAASAIERIRAGDVSLAYQPGCGTSEVASAVSFWLVYMTSMIFTLLVGGSSPVSIFFAFSVIVIRVWLTCETALGLLAQRLFTVSTTFQSASIVDVREIESAAGHRRPDDETWFEICVDIRIAEAPSRPGLVAPGAVP